MIANPWFIVSTCAYFKCQELYIMKSIIVSMLCLLKLKYFFILQMAIHPKLRRQDVFNRLRIEP